MENKAKIKVIKRADRPAIPSGKKAKRATAQSNPARDAVATVKSWVAEFQQNRRDDARTAFDSLFAATPDAV